MSQLSLFAADAQPAAPGDVAGLLAAHGQTRLDSSGGGQVASVSIVVDSRWRADALAAWLSGGGLDVTVTDLEAGTGGQRSETGSVGTVEPLDDGAPAGRFAVATAPTPALVDLARRWRKGAVKAVPADWSPTAGELRTWVLAAGRAVPPEAYGLGIDVALEQHAPQRDALLGALVRAGIAATFVRPRGEGPLLRITSTKRLRRLAETVGDAPAGVPAGLWPVDPALTG